MDPPLPETTDQLPVGCVSILSVIVWLFCGFFVVVLFGWVCNVLFS